MPSNVNVPSLPVISWSVGTQSGAVLDEGSTGRGTAPPLGSAMSPSRMSPESINSAPSIGSSSWSTTRPSMAMPSRSLTTAFTSRVSPLRLGISIRVRPGAWPSRFAVMVAVPGGTSRTRVVPSSRVRCSLKLP